MNIQADNADHRHEMEARLVEIKTEIRRYLPPIAGCDVQFQHLLDEQGEIAHKLRDMQDLNSA